MSLTRGISFRSLWAITAVANEGGINRAARKLHLSQPAVSRTIALAEEQLETRLFERDTSGLALTPAGDIYVRRISRALDYLREAEQKLSRKAENAKSSPFYRKVSRRHLVAVIEISESENVTYAARKLGLTQPAVYRSLTEMERILDLSLFVRHHHRMIPTPEGATLIRYAKLAFAELRYAEEEVATYTGTLTGRLSIGSLPLARTMLVPRAIANLSVRHSSLTFSIIDGPYLTLLSGLRSGDIDLIVGALRDPAPVDDVHEETLFRDPLSIVARSNHSLARRRRITLDQIASASWIVPREGTPTRTHFESIFQNRGLPVPQNIVEASSLIAIRGLLLESDRLTIISRSQIHYEEQLGVLTVLPIALDHTKRPIGITTRVNMQPTPGIAALIDELRRISREMYGHTGMAQRAIVPASTE